MPWFNKKKNRAQHNNALIIPKKQHTVRKRDICPNAVQILTRLQKAGFQAYLVGGAVRDLLAGRRPKDFDIATDAKPEQVKKLFKRSLLIGRRFRIVHVLFGREYIEVTTLRAGTPEYHMTDEHAHPTGVKRDNEYGECVEQDAYRRDFSINALYYNYEDETILDYTDGMQDIANKQVRIIGDPDKRFHEDPLRLLRAIRLAAKLEFDVEPATEEALTHCKALIPHVSPARLFDEYTKLFLKGHALDAYDLLHDYGYFPLLFPNIDEALHAEHGDHYEEFFETAFSENDRRYNDDLSLSPGYLVALLYWPVLQERMQQAEHLSPKEKNAFYYDTIEHIFRKEMHMVSVPKRLIEFARSVWTLQKKLVSAKGRQVKSILRHRYYRAAIDFLELRATSGEPLSKIAAQWRQRESAQS